MKLLVRIIGTIIYAVCWVLLLPIMGFLGTVYALVFWANRNESRPFLTIWHEELKDQFACFPKPNELWM